MNSIHERAGGAILGVSISALILIAGEAAAQNTDPLVIPHVTATDENQVDLVGGVGRFRITALSIGGGGEEISYTARGGPNGVPNPSYWDSFRGGFSRGLYEPTDSCTQSAPSGSQSVGWGERFQCFVPSGSGYAPEVAAQGGTLVANGGLYIYTTRDGDEATIDPSTNNRVTQVRFADGRTWTYRYWRIDYYDPSTGTKKVKDRLQSVSMNNGLQFRYSYTSEDSNSPDWYKVVRVTGVNTAYDYCDPGASSCSYSRSWPSATFSWGTNTYTVTDAAGGVTRYTFDGRNRVTAVKPANSVNDVLTYRHCNGPNEPVCSYFHSSLGTTYIYDKVVSSTNNGQNWSYLLTSGIGGRYTEYKSTGPDTNARGWSYTGTSGVNFLEFIEKDSTTFSYELGGTRLRAIRKPASNEIRYGYDSRLNVIEARQVAKPNTGLADLVSTAGYEAGCTTPRTCNKPLWKRDRLGNQTDFTYSSTHGGLLTETGPAVGGVRPQKRYSYAQRYAWYKDASGNQVRGTSPVWVLTEEAFCKTQSNCAGTSDEVRTTYDYGPDSGPNNLFLRGKVVDAGGAALRTCYGYDEYGRSPGEADTRYQYTGQMWLPAIAAGIYNYKNRIYHARFGRFLQTDPIGYGDGMNMYAYVGADPVNFTDPEGTSATRTGSRICGGGTYLSTTTLFASGGGGGGGEGAGGGSGGYVCVKNCAPAGFAPGSGDNLGTFTARAGKYQWFSSGIKWVPQDGRYVVTQFTASPRIRMLLMLLLEYYLPVPWG